MSIYNILNHKLRFSCKIIIPLYFVIKICYVFYALHRHQNLLLLTSWRFMTIKSKISAVITTIINNPTTYKFFKNLTIDRKTFKVAVFTSDLLYLRPQALFLKVVSATFLLVCFLCLKDRTCETRKNVFYFTSKALFVLEIIKF